MPAFFMPRPSAYAQNLNSSDGAKLYFFESGTTTPKATYTDTEETIPSSVPVVANGDGIFEAIYITGSYKVVLHDKNDVLIWEEDDVVQDVSEVWASQGLFDSSTNGGDYPESGLEGYTYKVSTGFTLNAGSGSHTLETGDFIYCNKDTATGIDADWDILRGVKGLIYGLGVRQTWQDLTVSRALSSTVYYTNSTGGPIQVNVRSTQTNSIINMQGYVKPSGGSDLRVDNFYHGSETDGVLIIGSISFIVPDGDEYRVHTGFTLDQWLELRA